jgi:putative CocE/NonD family hydrolase
VPQIDQQLRVLAPILFKEIYGAKIELPPDRHADKPSWEAARAAYEAEPMVRVLFESGGTSNVGAPEARYQATFPAWPPKTQPVRYYFRKDGSMTATAPTEPSGASQFEFDPSIGQRSNVASGGDIWALIPKWDWKPLETSKSVAWVSEPMTEDTVMVGTASVDLYVQSSAPDADLQVVLSEVRPDGQELFVQAGALRSSMRTLAREATPLWPEHGYREADAAPLPADKWTEVRVGIPGFGHAFRKGSRLRLSVGTPGGNHAEWRFEAGMIPAGSTHRIAHSIAQPSSILLPVVSGVTVPASLPLCPSLRGQPCRPYQALVNTPVP